MKCPRCQHENRPGARFCEECAAPLVRRCSNCGADVSGAATKCPKCGAVFDEEPAAEDKEGGSEPPAKVLPSPRGESKKGKAR